MKFLNNSATTRELITSNTNRVFALEGGVVGTATVITNLVNQGNSVSLNAELTNRAIFALAKKVEQLESAIRVLKR
jgi:hypothetical protein